MRRTQIYLDEEQDRRLARRAKAERTTKSHVVREAIQAYLDAPDDEVRRLAAFKAAMKEAAGIAPYLPPGKEYVEKLRRLGAKRQRDLERRWRR